MVNYRRVRATDRHRITECCEIGFEKIKTDSIKEWIEQVDLRTALRYIFDKFTEAYIVEDSYLVVFAVDTAWYATEPMLMEQLVLSLRPGGNFDAVTDFLEEQAKRHEVDFVSVGTSLAPLDAALALKYQRRGFYQEAIALVKRIPRNVRKPTRSLCGQAKR